MRSLTWVLGVTEWKRVGGGGRPQGVGAGVVGGEDEKGASRKPRAPDDGERPSLDVLLTNNHETERYDAVRRGIRIN